MARSFKRNFPEVGNVGQVLVSALGAQERENRKMFCGDLRMPRAPQLASVSSAFRHLPSSPSSSLSCSLSSRGENTDVPGAARAPVRRSINRTSAPEAKYAGGAPSNLMLRLQQKSQSWSTPSVNIAVCLSLAFQQHFCMQKIRGWKAENGNC